MHVVLGVPHRRTSVSDSRVSEGVSGTMTPVSYSRVTRGLNTHVSGQAGGYAGSQKNIIPTDACAEFFDIRILSLPNSTHVTHRGENSANVWVGGVVPDVCEGRASWSMTGASYCEADCESRVLVRLRECVSYCHAI